MGHTRIGLLSGPLGTSTGQSRVTGYQRALTDAGIAWDPVLVRDVPFRGNAGGDAVTSLLSTPNPPSALIVANTAQVQNAMRRLIQMKTRIPDDLSVIVFDDNPWTELLTPPLSAVHQPIEMLALHSIELLLGRMRGRVVDGPRTIEIQAEFIPRGSCTPPRKT